MFLLKWTLSVCAHTHTHIYINIYIHTHINIYIHTVQVFSPAAEGIDWMRCCQFSDSELTLLNVYVSLNEPLCCSPLGRRPQSPRRGSRLCEQLPAETIGEKIYAAQLAVVLTAQNEGSQQSWCDHSQLIINFSHIQTAVCYKQPRISKPFCYLFNLT